jgi:hypothetical protein
MKTQQTIEKAKEGGWGWSLNELPNCATIVIWHNQKEAPLGIKVKG